MISKIKQIKKSRFNPIDNYLFNIFGNLEKYYSDLYPKSVFLLYKNDILFEYDKTSKYLYCSMIIWNQMKYTFDKDTIICIGLLKYYAKSFLNVDVIPRIGLDLNVIAKINIPTK